MITTENKVYFEPQSKLYCVVCNKEFIIKQTEGKFTDFLICNDCKTLDETGA